MSISNAEWWMRAAARPRPEFSVGDKLRQAVELMAANVGRQIGRLVNPPYPTPDGKPLEVISYGPNDPQPFKPKQLEQLTAFVRMS